MTHLNLTLPNFTSALRCSTSRSFTGTNVISSRVLVDIRCDLNRVRPGFRNFVQHPEMILDYRARLDDALRVFEVRICYYH